MNNSLNLLWRMNDRDNERTVKVLMVVQAYDSETATSRETRRFRQMHANLITHTREVINEFTSNTGLFNIDHVAWQLGLDITPGGFTTVDPPDDSHVCLPQDLVYQGHYRAIGRGTAHKCSICNKVWSKLGNQYSETPTMTP